MPSFCECGDFGFQVEISGMHVKEEEEDEFEFQSFLNGDCVSKLSIAATGDEYQIGKEGGFYYDPNPTINDTVKRTKSNNHSSIDSSSSNIGFEDSRIVNERNSTTIANDSSGGVKRIHPSPKAIFSEFKPIHLLLETADIIVDDNNKNNKSKDSSCSEDDEEGKAVVNDTAAAAQSRPKISFQIVNPKLKKKKKKDIKNMTSNVTQEQQQEQQHQQQQQQSKIVGVVEEESFDFTTINDKDFIASWMTMQNTILMDF
jgi:hypothetical protein